MQAPRKISTNVQTAKWMRHNSSDRSQQKAPSFDSSEQRCQYLNTISLFVSFQHAFTLLFIRLNSFKRCLTYIDTMLYVCSAPLFSAISLNAKQNTKFSFRLFLFPFVHLSHFLVTFTLCLQYSGRRAYKLLTIRVHCSFQERERHRENTWKTHPKPYAMHVNKLS